MPPPDPVRIGQLQWPVTIYRRDQAPSVSGTGITETLVEIATVRADIQPVGALTYYAGAQVETPITHRIFIRFLDYLDTTHVIKRVSIRQDGETRTEVFRIRRMKWFAGDNRFLDIEAELENET